MKKVLVIAAVLDVIWALVVATFGAALLGGLGDAAGVGSTTVAVGSVLGWIITFVIALFQGAVFLAVFGVFVCVVIMAAANRRARNGGRRF